MRRINYRFLLHEKITRKIKLAKPKQRDVLQNRFKLSISIRKMSQEIISEVLEYQIMYTTQITQKIKKWNDGKMKYFKFNNKAEIFNEDNLLISKEFLRNDSHLTNESNWGEQIKIGGVLITIDSLISESSRDISKVFQKSIKQSERTPAPLKTIQRSLPTPSSITKNASPVIKRRRVGLSRSGTPSKISINRSSNAATNFASSRTSSHAKSMKTSFIDRNHEDDTVLIDTPSKRVMKSSLNTPICPISRAIPYTIKTNTDSSKERKIIPQIFKDTSIVPAKQKLEGSIEKDHICPVEYDATAVPKNTSNPHDSSNVAANTILNNLMPVSARTPRSLLFSKSAPLKRSQITEKDENKSAGILEVNTVDGRGNDDPEKKLELKDDQVMHNQTVRNSTSHLLNEISKVLENEEYDSDGRYEASLDNNSMVIKKEIIESESEERGDYITWDSGDKDDEEFLDSIKNSVELQKKGGSIENAARTEVKDNHAHPRKRKVSEIIIDKRTPLHAINLNIQTSNNYLNKKRLLLYPSKATTSQSLESSDEETIEETQSTSENNAIGNRRLTQTITYNYGDASSIGGVKISEAVQKRM